MIISRNKVDAVRRTFTMKRVKQEIFGLPKNHLIVDDRHQPKPRGLPEGFTTLTESMRRAGSENLK